MKIVGALMIALGVVVGLYLGIWWMFIGGIVQIIEQVRAVDMSAGAVAIGVARVFFAGFVGYASAALLIIPGILLLDD